MTSLPNPRLNRPWATKLTQHKSLFALLAFALVGCLAFTKSDFIESFKRRLILSTEVRLRSLLEQTPPLHPNLKILAYDDAVVGRLMRPNLTLAEWSQIIENIGDKHPKAIVIDAHFALLGNQETDIAKFRKVLTVHKVVTGVFLTPNEVPHWVPFEFERPEFSLGHWVNSDIGQDQLFDSQPLDSQKFVYGADPRIRAEILKFGHLSHEGFGTVYPVKKISEKNAATIVLPLAAIGTPLINASGLAIQPFATDEASFKIPLDSLGRLEPNFPSLAKLYERYEGVDTALSKNTSRFLSELTASDIVLIIPEFYTGGTDFKETSVGPIPGGFIHAAIVNSYLTKRWIRHFEFGSLSLILIFTLGAALGALFSVLTASLLVLTLCLLCMGSAVAAFVYCDVQVAWVSPMFCFLVPSALTIIDRSRRESLRAKVAVRTLKGLVDPRKLEFLLARKDHMPLKPKEVKLSVLFIDIVGFSHWAETMRSEDVFSMLTEQIGRMTSLIHAFEGTVDRTLGDGLLAYFGYSYIDDRTTDNHANAALRCALGIQDKLVHDMLAAPDPLSDQLNQRALPVRIGINTCRAAIGNLGGKDDRIDFTILGSGVNLASRLEGVCGNYSVLVSESTFASLTPETRSQHVFHKKLSRLKHHSSTTLAYECSPLQGTFELKRLMSRLAANAPNARSNLRHWLNDVDCFPG